MVIASAAVAGTTNDQLLAVLVEIFFLAQFLALFPIVSQSSTQHALVQCAHCSKGSLVVNHYRAKASRSFSLRVTKCCPPPAPST